MEPQRGFWPSLWDFICFLPVFTGLLILGFIKGIIMFPVILVIMSIGISGIILGLWPIHFVYTYYTVLSTKQFGPALKLILCPVIAAVLISWLPCGIISSVFAGLAYGILAPVVATFAAIDEGKTDKFYHCILDGTWGSVQGSFTIIRDFLDVCYHSYFSIMHDLLHCRGPPEGKYYEIRLIYVPLAVIAGILGSIVDFPVITGIALCKSPYMLFKGWGRLFHDWIGREGPFLETICVPFAALAILLWPLAVGGAVFASIVSSVFLGAYASVVVYKESSFWFGLCYIVASLSIYDEYINDVLDMPEGSCFPRPIYSKKGPSRTTSVTTSISSASSFKTPPTRTGSLIVTRLDLKPLELIDGLFKECQRNGDLLSLKGIITRKDIQDTKNNKSSCRVLTLGLPTFCLLQTIQRSIKANSTGLVLINDVELTTSNRPKDAYFDWFLSPLLVIKDQIKAAKLSETEEEYLGVMVVLNGTPDRLKDSKISSAPDSEVRRAELNALARRLQGIMNSISRYPTVRRRFETSTRKMLEHLDKESNDGSLPREPCDLHATSRSKSMFVRIFSMRQPAKSRTNSKNSDQEAQTGVDERDMQKSESDMSKMQMSV